MKKGYYKGRLAIAVAFALSLTSFSSAGLSTLAAQGPVNESYQTPFGQVADYNQEQGIGVVWGAAGYDSYTVTISCKSNGYEKVYSDQNLGYHWYPDDYSDGEYIIEIQGQRDGELSAAAVTSVTVGNPSTGDEGEANPEDPATGNPEDPAEPVTPGTENGNEEQNEDTSGIDFDTINHTADYIDAGTDVKVDYSGVRAIITGSDWGNDWGNDSHWQIQLKEVVDTSLHDVYDVSFNISSKAEREVFIKLGDLNNDGTVFAEQTVQLSKGKNRVSITTDKEVDIDDMMVLFALGTKWGSDENTIVISNLKGAPHTATEVKEGAISLADADTELYVGSDWAGTAASVKETGTKAEFTVGSYGWNGEWGLQYIIKNLGLTEGETYTLSADITSSINKKVMIKLDDSGHIVDTVDLTAGETYEYSSTVTSGAFANNYLYFALGQMSGESANLTGALTIENLRICDSQGNYVSLSGGSANGSKGLEYDFTLDNSAYDYADPGREKDGYTLIWADEFDGNYEGVDSSTGLNLDNWGYQLGDGSTDCGNYGWGNNELQAYTRDARNVGVNEDLDGDGDGEGLLRITAAYEKNGYNYASESKKNYTSARLRTTTATEELFNSTYGYIEGRISLPQTKGAWPAFWMLPQSTDIYGGWPVSGEIDILETTGTQSDQACSTIHWGVPSHVYKGSGYTKLDSDVRYFHTYAVDWEPGKMTFYYDGKEIYSSSNWLGAVSGASDSLGFDAPFDEPFYMILNLAVDSGQFGGSANKADFQDEINMYVDYVRCFQKTDGYADSVTKDASDSSKSDWEQYQGINQIAEITATNLDAVGGGHNDAAASGTGKWYLSNQDNASANAETVTDSNGTTWAKVNVTGTGNQDYGVQLIGHYDAKAGYVYKVSYDTYAEGGLVGKQVNCDAKEYGGWSTYGIQAFTLSGEPSHNSFLFQQTEDFDNCRIEFNIGGQATGTVYVSNVKVEIVDPAAMGTTDPSGAHGVLADGNMIFNGTFDQGNNHTGYWSTLPGTTLSVPRYTTTALRDSDVKVKDIASMSNYENIPGGIKYYERRGQVSPSGDTSAVIYQSGIRMKADTYTLSFDLYSDTDSAVKASINSISADDNGIAALGSELGSAKASYSAGDGVRRYNLTITTAQDLANGAVALTFAKGTKVQIDNVRMTGANQESVTDETPVDGETTWTGDSGAGSSIAIEKDADGTYSMKNITSGGTWYSPQIGSSNFTVLAGLKYKFSLDYKITGNSNGKFKYIVQENGGSWTVVQDIVEVDSKDLTKGEDGFCHYEKVFTAGASLDDCHLNFGFGDSAATGDMTFCFKNVSLTLVKEGSEEGGASDNDGRVDDGIFVPTPVPENPDTPDNPGNPDDPTNPDNPDDPGTPDEPGDPDTPDNPDTPDTPDEPDTPDKPQPPAPVNPGTVVKAIVKVVTTVVTTVVKAVSTVAKALGKLFGFR